MLNATTQIISDQSGRLPVRSFKDRLDSATRTLIDERLARVWNTVVTLTTCPSCRKRFVGELHTAVTKETRECRYLAMVVNAEDGRVSDEDVRRFDRLIVYLIENRMVDYGTLADPLFMPLKSGQLLMTWYVLSDYSREELNQKLGCECFVEEGEIYNGVWPQIAQ